MILDILQDFPVCRNYIRLKAYDHGLDPDHNQKACQDQGLDMAAACPLEQEEQETDPEKDSENQRDRPKDRKKAQGLVHHKRPDNGQHGFLYIAEHAAKKSGRAQLPIGTNRDRGHRNFVPSSLDNGFQRVCIFIHHVEPHGRFAAVCPKAAWGVRDIGIRRLSDDPTPEMLEFFLERREMLGLVDGALPDHNICLAFQDWTNQFLDIVSAVLVVRVGIDDDIGTVSQAGIQSCHEAFCKAFVASEVYDIMDAPSFGNLDGVVFASVVDDEIFDGINAVDMFGEGIESDFQGFCFVIAGDLDDEFHLCSFLTVLKLS